MSKRKHSNAFEDAPKLRLKLASTAEPGLLVADRTLLCAISSVASGLPDADEWDLSGLLVDGQPVSSATVIAWLNAAYQTVRRTDFQPQQQDENPAYNGEGLYRLLAFADAVASTLPVLEACCAQLQALQLHAQLGQQQVALDTDGTSYFYGSRSQKLCRQPDISKSGTSVADAPAAASAEEQQAFKQQVAAQTEQLLWLAYRLELQPLMQHLHRFVQALSFFTSSVLRDVEDAVFTTRVLEAAGVASLPGGKQMLMSSVLGEALSLTDSTITGLTEQQRQPLKFKAVLPSSSLRIPQHAPVAVELDLFGASTIQLGVAIFDLQLRIGPHAAP